MQQTIHVWVFCERCIVSGKIVISKNGESGEERSHFLIASEEQRYGEQNTPQLQLAVKPGVMETRVSRPIQ